MKYISKARDQRGQESFRVDGFGDQGNCAMNAYTRILDKSGNDGIAPSTPAAKNSWGLGPNQLNWLRRNIDAFRHLEEQRYLLRQDSMRAARLAGLI
jgi:hypothetical protein